jgi:ABC-2 type transport system permease protein
MTSPKIPVPAQAIGGFSTFRHALRFEWLLLWRDRAARWVLALLVLAVGYSVHAGAEHWRRHQALVDAARADESQRLQTLREQLAAVEAGRLKPASPFRDPRSALWVGLTHGAHVAALPPAPLAAAAVGLSDVQPALVKVSARTPDEFLFSDELRNPLHLLSGAVDLAFVLVFVLPLAILALTYNLASADREGGTLALLASTGAPLRAVLLARLLLRAGLPLLATWAAMAVALPLAAGGGGAAFAVPLAGLFVATGLYAAFWALLAAGVNTLGRESAYNALLLAGAWVALVLLVPALSNLLADTLYPVPSRAEMVLAVRGASVDTDRERDASLARYRDEHPEAQPDEMRRGSARERVARRLATVDAAARRIDAIVRQHNHQLARRQALVDGLAWWSPALLMQLTVTDLAGGGTERFNRFHSQLDAFHDAWREFFLSRARADQPLRTADFDSFPHFIMVEEAGRLPDAAYGRGVGLLAVVLVLGGVAARRLQRVGPMRS